MKILSRDPRLAMLALLTSMTSAALAVSGEVSPIGLLVPVVALVSVLRPRQEPRGAVFEWGFQFLALGFLVWFLFNLIQAQVLAGAAALTFPVLAHAFLQPPDLRALRRIQTLGFFQLVALAASTTAIFFGPLVLAWLVLSPAVFTLGALEQAAGEPRKPVPLPRGLQRSSALAALACLLTGIVLFLALPRYEAGLLSQLRRQGQRISGFSEKVSLGDITSIQSSDAIVMRVRLRGEAPKELRWRGIALDRFTGREWSATAPAVKVQVRNEAWQVGRPTQGASRLVQEFQVEPIQVRALFHAGRPTALTPLNFRAIRTDAWGNITRLSDTVRRARYEVSSELSPDRTPLTDDERAAFLQLPVLDPRIEALAHELGGTGDDAARARRITAGLQGRCEYGLDVDDRGVADPIAWFLFEKRRGHCEYFATSLAIMLRSQGIPARVVNGFQQGEYSRLFRAWIVRQRDAHSWVEAWLPGAGWTTLDATPAAGTQSPGFDDAVEIWRQVQILWDDNVIGFNYTFQLGFIATAQDALAALRARARGWGGVAGAGVVLALVLLAGAGVLRAARRRRPRGMRPRVAFYARAVKLLARKGHARRPDQTPLEHAREVAAKDPAAGEAALEIARLYYDARYGGVAPDEKKVRELLDRLAA